MSKSRVALCIDLVFSLLWLAAFGVVVAHFLRATPAIGPGFIGACATLALLSLSARRRRTRLLASMALGCLLVPLYAYEVHLQLKRPRFAFYKLDRVLELRRAGVESYPAVYPSGLAKQWTVSSDTERVLVEGQPLLPLGGIANAETVYCKGEDGPVDFRSDRAGFRNPDSAWQQHPLELAILGDALVQGFCVDDETTLGEQLRALGTSLAFGTNGSSVLVQYATYSEYVRDLAPHRLVWLFFEGNNLATFKRELDFAPFRAYLDAGHSQQLARRAKPLDASLRSFVDALLSRRTISMIAHDLERDWPDDVPPGRFDLLRLRETRTWAAAAASRLRGRDPRALDRLRAATDPDQLSAEQWQQMTTLWRRVVEAQRDRGGSVTFVYVPSRLRFLNPETRNTEQPLEQRVTGIWSALGADVLSLTQPLASSEDPPSLFDPLLDPQAHFNQKGYREAGRLIAQHLAR